MIAEDRIETVGAGIDAVTDHVIVTVVTLVVIGCIDTGTHVSTWKHWKGFPAPKRVESDLWERTVSCESHSDRRAMTHQANTAVPSY